MSPKVQHCGNCNNFKWRGLKKYCKKHKKYLDKTVYCEDWIDMYGKEFVETRGVKRRIG